MKKLILNAAALNSILLLAGCSSSAGTSSKDQLVECYGVSNTVPSTPLMMSEEICKKLAHTKMVSVTADDYVECYGVAAAGENDCATNSTACGGTAAVDRAPNAWVAIPQGVCMNIKGAVVGQLEKKAVVKK